MTLILHAMDEARMAALLGSSTRREELAAYEVAAFTFRPSAAGFRQASAAVMQVATASGDVLPCIYIEAEGAKPTGQVRRLGFDRISHSASAKVLILLARMEVLACCLCFPKGP